MATYNRPGCERNYRRPLYLLEDPSLALPTHPANFLGIPLTGLDTMVQIDHEDVARTMEELYGDKILVSFENNCLTNDDVRAWLEAFNMKEIISLSLEEPLINLLFVIKVNALDVHTTIDQLVEQSPIYVNETYTSINRYSPFFNPEDPYREEPRFKQLVTKKIKKGSRLLYKYIDCLIEPIGKLLHPNYALGLQIPFKSTRSQLLSKPANLVSFCKFILSIVMITPFLFT